MLILQGSRGRSAGQDQPGMELRAIVLEEQQEMTGTTRTTGRWQTRQMWTVQRLYGWQYWNVAEREPNCGFNNPRSASWWFHRFSSAFNGCCCCCCCWGGWYRRAARQCFFVCFFSFIYHFTPTRLSNEPSAPACQTSASQESAKMLRVNLWSDLGSHSIQSHPPSL